MDENDPRIEGQQCLEHFKKYEKRLADITLDMVRELNTRPLTLLPVEITTLGFRIALAFRLGKSTYCPIAILQTSDSLKAIIDEVHLDGEFEIVSQDKVQGFKDFSTGTLWKKLDS